MRADIKSITLTVIMMMGITAQVKWSLSRLCDRLLTPLGKSDVMP
jgi:hypothetical protein